MKFYKYTNNINYLNKIYNNKLTAIYKEYDSITFFKNVKEHNSKNASFIAKSGFKQFCLNGKSYGDDNDFTKESWRKFVKMQVFK
jgi:hypothetical protein